MNILHITDIANENGNGVAVAVKSYVDYEKKYCNVAIYNIDSNIKVQNIKCFSYENFDSLSSLPQPFNKPDLVIFNEVYKVKYLKLYKECIKRKIMYIVVPHGSLVKEAQSKKKIKKTIGNLLFFNKFILNASAIQFLTKKEKNASKFKYRKSIIISNGVTVPKKLNNKPVSKDFIYIGRYDIQVKGLDLIITMCSKYKEWFLKNNIKIQLYGRKTGHGNDVIEQLKKMILDNEVENIIIINDAIYNEEKVNLINKSYAFIQTSRHEGQPMGIIEALAYGVPCIVTKGTGFSELVEKYNCGIGIDFNSDMLFDGIKKMSTDNELRNEMSKNAFNIARENFDWNIITKTKINEYTKIVKEKTNDI